MLAAPAPPGPIVPPVLLAVSLLMVLPAWPPLAVPPSAMLFRPELLHASPRRPATMRAVTVPDILNIWSSVCSPTERQTQSTGLAIQPSSHKLRLGIVT